MQILALETSTDFGTCALWQNGQVLSAVCPAGHPHSETLLTLVQEMLAEAGSSFSQLDAIAFGMGPGAFTGLRVVCGIAQGLAMALDKPVLPVGSLEAMAWEAGGAKVLSLLDARMGEVYVGGFIRQEQGLEAVIDLTVTTPDNLNIQLDADWFVVGNGLKAYPQLNARFETCTLFPDMLPHAKTVAQLGALAFARGEVLDPALAAPRYIRDKVARTTAERLADGGKS